LAQKRILIISFNRDLHAQAIRQRLHQLGAAADIIDTATFPTDFFLEQREGRVREIDLNGCASDAYHAIWWRRVRAPRVAVEVKDDQERRYAAQECREALFGALHATGLPIYNNPEKENRAVLKPYQLRIAAQCGLDVPTTLISNRPDAVRAFRKEHTNVIYKAFSAPPFMLADTRPLADDDLPELWRLTYAPAIFQAYIPLGREYRVTLIADRAFVAEIKIQQPEARFDWRVDPKYEVLPASLDSRLIQRLQELRIRLGLDSGSIDLRECPSGNIYFLEINPTGQFLFLDAYAGFDTATAFCEMLLQDRKSAASNAPSDARR
jgi:glutathione synthase/RimK-type ligase-like ATP-grasp enzyme